MVLVVCARRCRFAHNLVLTTWLPGGVIPILPADARHEYYCAPLQLSQLGPLLQLVEHIGQGVFDSQRLLNFVGGDIRILPVLDEARALMIADELDERFRVCFPIRGKPFEVFEDRIDSGLCKKRDRVLSVFIEIRVEDSLIHELRIVVEEHPAKIMELEGSERIGITLQCFRQPVPIVPNGFGCSRLHLRDDRESITRRCLGEDRTVFALLQMAGLFRDDDSLCFFSFL
jgi:hypothetical protein